MAETRSTCCYCGVGCGVIIQHEAGRITGVRGDPDHPANHGRLCTKGSTLHLTAAPHLTAQVRALRPMQRPARGQPLAPIAWDTALDTVADRLAGIVRTHGPDAIGLYLSGQLLTEDYYVFNKLAKGLLGTNNVDTNSRLCMSSAVAGYKATLGADAPPACYDDLALADTVFISGSNTAWAHPVLFRRLEDAKRMRPQQRWIVVDPRRTETAEAADLHLQIQPGTDVVLHHALLHLMLWEGLVDHAFINAHTTGFAALRDRVREFTPAHAAQVCGLKADDIVQAARWFAGLDGAGAEASSDARGAAALSDPGGGARPGAARRPTLSLYCQGLNQSIAGTDNNATLINLHLACGQIGRPGAGPLSLTGQPNAMGGREVGGLATLLSGHRDLADPAHRAEVAALWGVPEVPAAPGLDAVAMFEAAAEGRLQALWIVCTNPAHSLPDQALVRQALERCPLVIVQEACATTATAAHADLLLPASSWGEKSGTVTNSERRISRVNAAVPPPGEARDDWRIAVDIGRRLEARLGPRRRDGGTLFPYDDAEAIWCEHRETTRGRDLDITGLSYASLAQQPAQWPCPAGSSEAETAAASAAARAAAQAAAEAAATPAAGPAGLGAARADEGPAPARADGSATAAPAGQARLYTDHRFATPDGRARFVAPAWRPVAEPRDARYPVALTTGRLRDQWHGMSRTGTLGRLFAHDPEPAIELHPQDLARRGWPEGTLLTVASRRGQLVLPARASPAVAPAQAFVAMHWGPETLAGGVNRLTPRARCPQSKQPELKHAAVRLSPATLPWGLVAAAWLPPEAAQALRERLKALLPRFAYAVCVPFGRESAPADLADSTSATPRQAPVTGQPVGLLFRAAGPAPDAASLAEVEAVLGLQDAPVLRYADARTGQARVMRIGAEGTLGAFVLAGDTAAAGWVLDLLQQRQPAAALGRALLAAGPRPPVATPPRSRQVCACQDVAEDRIAACLRQAPGSLDERVRHAQQATGCGTGCGACLPAVRAMARHLVPAAHPRLTATA